MAIDRDEFVAALHAENVGSGIHYVGVHLHSYYRERFGYRPEDFPVATDISKRTVSLPLSSALTDGDIDDVIRAVTRILTHYER